MQSSELKSKDEELSRSSSSKVLKLKYSRTYGFSKNDWNIIKSKTPATSNYIEKYADLVKNENSFRYITFKTIERFCFIIAFVLFLLSLIMKQLDLGLVGFLVFSSIAYFFSIDKALRLRKLRKRFAARIKGVDVVEFKIENLFGKFHWLVYFFVPYFLPDIYVVITFLVSSNF